MASSKRQRPFDALEIAARRGWRRRARQLVDGIGVSATDQHGRTALMIVAAFGGAEMVRHLLEAGADANAADDRGMTPLMHAAEAGKIASPGGGPIEAARLLLDARADPRRRCKLGWTAEGIALYWEAHMMFVAPERVALARLLRSACRSRRRRKARRRRIR